MHNDIIDQGETAEDFAQTEINRARLAAWRAHTAGTPKPAPVMFSGPLADWYMDVYPSGGCRLCFVGPTPHGLSSICTGPEHEAFSASENVTRVLMSAKNRVLAAPDKFGVTVEQAARLDDFMRIAL